MLHWAWKTHIDHEAHSCSTKRHIEPLCGRWYSMSFHKGKTWRSKKIYKPMALRLTFKHPNYLLDFQSRCFSTSFPHHSYSSTLYSKPASIYLQHSCLTITHPRTNALYLRHATVGNLRREAVTISFMLLAVGDCIFCFKLANKNSRGHTYITLDAGITLAHVRPVPVSLPTHPYTHQTNTVEMINSTFEVTFGIEVECILAFHETLLRNHLATTTTANPKIIKTIPDDTRRKLNQVSQHYLDEDTRHHDVSRQRYMGWALTTPTSYPPSRDNIGFQSQFDAHLSRHGYRAYGGEILQLAQTLLPTGVEVHDSFHTDKYTGDFSHWHLTHERGLVGVDKEELTKRLLRRANDEAGHILPDDNRRTCPVADEWDNHPLELVSRVLPYNAASLAEITAHITALRSGSKHFAFPTKHCGLHVHVGLPVPPKYVPVLLSPSPQH